MFGPEVSVRLLAKPMIHQVLWYAGADSSLSSDAYTNNSPLENGLDLIRALRSVVSSEKLRLQYHLPRSRVCAYTDPAYTRTNADGRASQSLRHVDLPGKKDASLTTPGIMALRSDGLMGNIE